MSLQQKYIQQTSFDRRSRCCFFKFCSRWILLNIFSWIPAISYKAHLESRAIPYEHCSDPLTQPSANILSLFDVFSAAPPRSASTLHCFFISQLKKKRNRNIEVLGDHPAPHLTFWEVFVSAAEGFLSHSRIKLWRMFSGGFFVFVQQLTSLLGPLERAELSAWLLLLSSTDTKLIRAGEKPHIHWIVMDCSLPCVPA